MNDWSADNLDKGDEQMREVFGQLEERIDAHRRETKEGFSKADERFARIEARLAQTPTRQEMKEGFGQLERQIMASRQEMKEGFAKVDERFVKIDDRFTKVDERFAKVDERLGELATHQDMNAGFAEMRSAYVALTGTLLVGALAIIATLIGMGS